MTTSTFYLLSDLKLQKTFCKSCPFHTFSHFIISTFYNSTEYLYWCLQPLNNQDIRIDWFTFIRLSGAFQGHVEILHFLRQKLTAMAMTVMKIILLSELCLRVSVQIQDITFSWVMGTEVMEKGNYDSIQSPLVPIGIKLQPNNLITITGFFWFSLNSSWLVQL